MDLESFSDREIGPRISKKEAEIRVPFEYCKARKRWIFAPAGLGFLICGIRLSD
jgi:hypothetical protein